MVQGRIVRPLRMGGGHPSSTQPLQEPPQQRKTPQRQSGRRHSFDDTRRRSSLDESTQQGGNHHRVGTPTNNIMSTRMKPMFGNPNDRKRKLQNLMPKFHHHNHPTSSHYSSADDDNDKFHNRSTDSNMDNMESQHPNRHHHRRPRPRQRREHHHQLSPQEYRRPFQIPSHAILSSRADLWIITALSSCVSLASFAQLLSSSKDAVSTSNRKFAFATSILSFLIACVLGGAFRYAPFRHQVTRCIISSSSPPPPPHYQDVNIQSPIIAGIKQAISQRYISIEILLVSFLSFFWTISIPIILDGFYTIGQDPLAVFGMEIWNANLFYSSWISVILIWYMLVELITSTDRYGTTTVSSSSKSSASSWKENTFSKRWILLTLSSIVVMSSSATIYGSNMCEGDILKGTDYCRKALIGILVGGFVQLLCCACVGCLYRLRNMNYTNGSSSSSYYYDSRGRRRKVKSRHTMPKMSVWKREKYSLYFAILSFLIQTINVGLLTSPIGGGPGNSSGSLYFASWASFLLVFEMCLRHLELHTSSVGRKVKRKSEKVSAYMDDATEHSVETYTSDEDDLPPEKQSNVMRMLKNGSLGSRSSSGAPVYEEVDSYSAESPRYVMQPQAVDRAQPPHAPHPPRATETNNGPKRFQIEPEEELKTSPNSSSRDFSASIRDFSIGSRSSSRDPSGDRQQKMLPRYSEVESASDDITNDEFFEEKVSRSQSFATYDSKEEELDEPRGLSHQYDVLQGSRHSKPTNLSPLNESSREEMRSSGEIRSPDSSIPSGSERSASQSGSELSGSRQSDSYGSGSKYSSEESQEEEHIPPPPVYRPKRQERRKSRSGLSKSRSRSGSRGERKSGSRSSSKSRSVYTDSDSDSSEDSPPPTVSDTGQSQRSDLSGFSHGSPASQSQSKSMRDGNNNGPPPPPFQRSETVGSQYSSDYQNSRPVTSVFTKKGLPGDESLVSDPTLDASFHPVPTRNTTNTRMMRRHRSDPSFDKSVASEQSYESEKYRRSSSDDLPSSEENLAKDDKGAGEEQVDNIVAAALAFAEKTHSVSSYGLQRSSPAPQSPKTKRNSGSSKPRRRRKSDSGIRASQTSGASSAISGLFSGSSLHSFYSGDASNAKKSVEGLGFNDSDESNPTQPSVQDMVTAAIAYAEKTRCRDGAKQQKRKSEKSLGSSGKQSTVKSVVSMFSDSEAYSKGEESGFDC